jgi:alkanesulfonate monooxygenase SsuD/methylene tetrahydromethanopterin reductase-like flavin-dependent oxidoreductase (luciferase family)
MQFSLIFEAQATAPTTETEGPVLRQCVEQAVFAEEMGFDRIWAVEHHGLEWYAHLSAPEVFLSWVAARTSRIRVGHGVVCMPFAYNHPVRVAERAATLDILSGGRLDLGAGRGATPHEMSLMGVDPAQTAAEVEEALRMIGHMWTEPTFQWDGLLKIEPHKVVPRPVQQPHPPLFLACSHADTVIRAADYGVGALVLGFGGPTEIGGLVKRYRDAAAFRSGEKLVATVVNDHVSALCPTIVLADKDEAARVGARGQRFFAESVAHYVGGPEPAQDTEHDDNAVEIQRSRDRVVDVLTAAGAPETAIALVAQQYSIAEQAYGDAGAAIDFVEQVAAAGADEVMCLVQMGGVPHAVCMETIERWGRDVIPRFRS